MIHVSCITSILSQICQVGWFFCDLALVEWVKIPIARSKCPYLATSNVDP